MTDVPRPDERTTAEKTLDAYGPKFYAATAGAAGFGEAAFALAGETVFSAAMSAAMGVAATLSISVMPVLIVGAALSAYTSDELQEQALKIPSILDNAPVSPASLLTIPASPLVSPANDPFMASRVATPYADLGMGVALKDVDAIKSFAAQSGGIAEDTIRYYEEEIRPAINNLAIRISDFRDSLARSTDGPANQATD